MSLTTWAVRVSDATPDWIKSLEGTRRYVVAMLDRLRRVRDSLASVGVDIEALGPDWAEIACRVTGVDPGLPGHEACLRILEWVQRKRIEAHLQHIPRLQAGPADGPTCKPDAAEFFFIRDGAMWRIRAFGAEGSFPPRVGFQRIAALIESPGKPIPMLRLVGKTGGTTMPVADALEHGLNPAQPAAQRIIDEEALRDLRRRIRELDAGIDAAERDGDVTLADVLGREREVVHDQLKRCLNRGGKPAAFRGCIENARTAIANSLRRAYADLREAGLAALAGHLEAYIRPEGDDYVYSPLTAIPWMVEKSLHEM